MITQVRNILYISISCLIVGMVSAQEKELQKATKQYEQYEYINAQETYLKVVEKGYRSAELFQNLGNSYYFNSQFKEAAKWYGELIQSYPEEATPEYYFRYSQTLKSIGKYAEADTYMEKFVASKGTDQRGQLFEEEPDYLERIDFQSGRFEIANVAINSAYTDFGTAFFGRHIIFSSSRDTLLFNKRIHQWNEESFLELFSAEYNATNGELSEVKKFGDGKLNTKFHESTPVFTKDGATVYFTRNNYDGKKIGKDAKGTNKLQLYRAYKNSQGSWTTPQPLPFNSDEFSTAHPALSIDEKTLYFSSDMPGGEGQSDLYKIAINSDGSFGTPENLGKKINTEGKETFPFISTNNDLYFASDGHIGLGGLDVFVTRLVPLTEEEGLVINIGKPVNSQKDDFAFIVDEASKRGYFSSNREEGKGKDDIYSFLKLEDRRSFCKITLTGVVTDKDTGELLAGAKVAIYDSSNNLIASHVVGADAAYTQEVKCGSEYFVRAEKENYVTAEKLVTTPGKTTTLTVPLLIENSIKKATIGDDLAKVLSLNPIYFNFDSATIRPDAAVELAKVIEVMQQYPQMKIEVRSHTDSRANDQYNLALSNRRAKATVGYIVSKGITNGRLTGKGYGESELVNHCKNKVPCSKENHQLNRRSEFIIVE